MRLKEITNGDRMLVKTSPAVREIVVLKGVNRDNGRLIVRTTEGRVCEVRPENVLKAY